MRQSATSPNPRSPKQSRYWATLLVLLGASVPGAAQVKHRSLQAALTGLLQHSVPTQTVGQQTSTVDVPVYLDAREWNEYQVSHLPGAIWVGYQDFSTARIPAEWRQKPIVVYCSVGYRSEKIAEQLLALGYPSVYNLYGGIFEWAHHAQPLVDHLGSPTQRVHAYDRRWGRLLRIRKKWKVYGP